MPRIPRDKNWDSTLALMRDPYGFIAKRCRTYGADLFQTRLMLQTTICMTGREAAELFYDPRHFVRHGATPGRIQKTLFGQGGVQGLDDEAHRHRKRMFMSLMTPDQIGQVVAMTADWWRIYIRKWAMMERVVLYDQSREILCRAVCAWAGVPLAEAEVGRRTQELSALFEYAGSVGPKHWWARLARKRAERWAEGIIAQVRAGHIQPPERSALRVIATHQDLDGALLSPRIAAVELLNVLRPTIAVSVFITFIAHALHRYPACRERLKAGESGYAALFVQEVRRFYPFFPAVAARVRDDFEWRGYPFPRAARVILDLYGTDHDPRSWQSPDEFRPERFAQWDGNPFDFIPQGGGVHHLNHRCPGEWITIELMKMVAILLAGRITYDVPAQDLRIDRSSLPALPRSRFVISNVAGDV